MDFSLSMGRPKWAGRLQWTILLVTLLIGSHVNGQLGLEISGGPSIQTIHLQEATITEGYKAVLLAEGGLRLRYSLPNGFGFRMGGLFLSKGANLGVEADSAGGHSAGIAAFRANFLALAAGVEYQSKLSDRFALIGSVDFVYGTLIRSDIRMVRGTGELVYKDFFVPDYFGLDLGLALKYELPGGIGFLVAPKLPVQLNYAYRSSFFKPKFNGFSPQLGIQIPLGGTRK